ncbi:MAG: YciI family protein, partial [Rudaea sp.]
MKPVILACLLLLFLTSATTSAESRTPAVKDPALAKKLGADELGMRNYVLVILKTGPHRVPDGPARKELFKGHFANITRLAKEGKLAVAGPFGDHTDWRGMFIFAVDSADEAKALVATDPVIRSGEMVAEYHLL